MDREKLKTIVVQERFTELSDYIINGNSTSQIQIVGEFKASIEAMKFVKSNKVDLALLDIEMQDMKCVELFDVLKKINPTLNIIFITSHKTAEMDEIIMRLGGIIFKPYNKIDIYNALMQTELLKSGNENRIYCRTFGKCDVFCNGKPIRFKSAKAKELFALCVYRRGALVSAEEIIDKLWANYTGTVGNCSIFRATVRALVGELKQIGCEEVFYRERGACSVTEKCIESDYYDFLRGDANAICEYQGEFLTDYTWASGEAYTLNEKKLLIKPNSLKSE